MLLEEAPLLPTTTNLKPEDNTSAITNPYTRGRRYTRLPGATWVLSVTYAKLTPEEANWFDAFFSVQKGGAAISRIRDLSYTHMVGKRLGHPVVKTQAVDGSVLETQGWDASVVDQVMVGTRFSFIDAASGLEELHIITKRADSDGSGDMTIEFTPELKRLPAAGVALDFNLPGFTGSMDKANSGVSRRDVQASCSIVFREALYV